MKIFDLDFLNPFYLVKRTMFNIVPLAPVAPTLLATLGPAAIAGGGALLGGLFGGLGANRASKRDSKRAKERLEEDKRQFDLQLELDKLNAEERKEEFKVTTGQKGLDFLAGRRDVLSGQIRNRRFRGSLMKALRGGGGGGGSSAPAAAPSVGLPI